MTQRNSNVKIIDGRIKTRSLEVHIVDHCNLRCHECCSLSPLLPERYVEPKDMQRDLQLATAVLSPTYIKLVGGEPLLHPNIIECLKVAKPMANILSVTTNGILLGKKSDAFWELINALTISIYPAPKLPNSLMQDIHEKAKQFDVSLNIKEQSNFVKMTQWNVSKDMNVTSDIYSICWLRESCHIVDRGRFYQCTRPPHFDTFFDEKKSFKQDGILLHEAPSLSQEIRQYLTSNTPLDSCFYCKGGNADEQPYRAMTTNEINQILELKL